MMGYLTFAIVGLAILTWAFLAYQNRKNVRPVVLPVNDWITKFRDASQRLGRQLDNRTILDTYNLKHELENPYAVAIQGTIKTMRALASGDGKLHGRKISGTEAPSINEPTDPVAERLELEHDFGLHAICEFVAEGHLPREEGERYHDHLAEIWRAFALRTKQPPAELTSFDSMLAAHTAKAGNST
jgi:hypothetical protein